MTLSLWQHCKPQLGRLLPFPLALLSSPDSPIFNAGGRPWCWQTFKRRRLLAQLAWGARGVASSPLSAASSDGLSPCPASCPLCLTPLGVPISRRQPADGRCHADGIAVFWRCRWDFSGWMFRPSKMGRNGRVCVCVPKNVLAGSDLPVGWSEPVCSLACELPSVWIRISSGHQKRGPLLLNNSPKRIPLVTSVISY